jgi:hypothetical protein
MLFIAFFVGSLFSGFTILGAIGMAILLEVVTLILVEGV